MPCTPIALPGGGVGIVCTRGRPRPRPCATCGRPGTRQCDAPAGKRSCSRWICDAHARHVGPDLDYCPEHRDAPRAHPPLVVHTARVSYAGPDRLDVTRGSGSEGLPLAPSQALLGPYLAARRNARGEAELKAAWAWYRPAYLAEMRASYRRERRAWDALLERRRVVLVCYCSEAERCHRAILRAHVLPALGAVDAGELP